MYNFNLIMFYSILGFILESVVYKISKANSHSSIFYGPYTLVYGFGIYFCLLFYNNISIKNNIISLIIFYLIFLIITTAIEYIAGNIINIFFKIDKWNYTNHKYHLGKYICLDYAIYWGLLASFVIYRLHPFFNNNIISKIPKNTSIIMLLIFIVDLILTIKNKNNV